MGRHELYAELPFVAVLGLQKKERSLSMAFSNAAALLESQESDNVSMLPTSENGMDPNDKEERVRRMSVILMDEIEGTDELYLTVPLVAAVMIASMFTFNCKLVPISSGCYLLQFADKCSIPQTILQLGTMLES